MNFVTEKYNFTMQVVHGNLDVAVEDPQMFCV